jgi:outer membrane protein with beta-barrel domain
MVQVEADLTYEQKGYTDGLEVTLHYVEAPLLVRFDPLPPASPARVFVVGGIAPAVLVACRTSGLIFINDPPPHQEIYSGACAGVANVDRTPHRFDLGGVAGLGVGWRFGFGALEIQARIERGLIDVGGYETTGKTVNHAGYVVAGFGRSL